MSHHDAEHHPQGPRTAADTAALLLELERGLKAFQYYPEGSAEREDPLDRCYRAWSHDLSRYGPLRLEVRGTSFWVGQPAAPVGPGRCEELARDFAMRSLWVLICEPEMPPESLLALLTFLSAEASELESGGALSAGSYPGIRISDSEWRSTLTGSGHRTRMIQTT